MKTEQDNNDRSWEINVNLSGLQAPTGGAREVPQDYYKGEVTDMYIRPEKPGRAVIKLLINEGPFSGTVRTTGINIPKDPEDKVRYYWRGFAESVGYDPSDLDKGEVNLSIDSFKGRTAHFFYTPKELSTDGYDRVEFLPPADWTSRSAEFTPSEAAPTTVTTPTTTTGGNTASADAVRNKLGLS